MAYPLPRFNLLNFRRQPEPKFVTSTRANASTGKQETYHDIQNDAGYGYKVVTPPCEALFPHLREGGNEGGKFSKTKQTASITTNLLRNGEDEQFQSERDDFFVWLAGINDACLDQMYDSDVGGATTAVRAKTKKRYSKTKTPEELEVMARKAFKKSAMVPLKSREGEEQLVTKCRAYTRDLAPRELRYVQPSGEKYVEMETRPQIRGGALLSTVFSIRPFAMAKDKYGLTYTLVPDIVVYSTGRGGRASAPMEVIETPGRSYTMSTSEGKDGKMWLNINDAENRRLEFRPVATEVVFGESLTGTGTLGNIAGVSESSAKYTGMTKEDPANPESIAFFDYVSKLADDVIAFALADDQLLTKLKAESKEEAEEMATESGQSYEECFQTIIREAFNSPVNKREQDDYRQLRFSQSVYSRTGTQNILPIHDKSGSTVESINRGAMIAPVLSPSVYFMADGKFGLKLSISLEHGIRVDSNPDASNTGGGVLYALKRAAENTEGEPSAKRARATSED